MAIGSYHVEIIEGQFGPQIKVSISTGEETRRTVFLGVPNNMDPEEAKEVVLQRIEAGELKMHRVISLSPFSIGRTSAREGQEGRWFLDILCPEPWIESKLDSAGYNWRDTSRNLQNEAVWGSNVPNSWRTIWLERISGDEIPENQKFEELIEDSSTAEDML